MPTVFGGGRYAFHRRLSVRLVFPHDILKTDHQTWHIYVPRRVKKIHLFWGQKVKGQDNESQKQCRRGSLHSCECWLFLVLSCIDLLSPASEDSRPSTELCVVQRNYLNRTAMVSFFCRVWLTSNLSQLHTSSIIYYPADDADADTCSQKQL